MASFSSRDLFCLAVLAAFASGCAHRPDSSSAGAPAKPHAAREQAVTAQDVHQTPVTSVEKALEGRFPGVMVYRMPDGNLTIRIRGAASLHGDNAPLYVIDGLPVEAGPSGAL